MRKFLTAIGAAALFAIMTPTLARAATDVTLCTGKDTGNYYFAGTQIQTQARNSNINVVLAKTNGSMQNLDLLMAAAPAAHCDAAIVQGDAVGVFFKEHPEAANKIEVGSGLYNEYAHLICNNDAGIGKITGLNEKHTVAIGNLGGGTATTWASFVSADKRYAKVATLPDSGVKAINKVVSGEATCMLFVTGLRAAPIMEANNIGLSNSGKLGLVAADDSDVLGLKNSKGKPVYTEATIPSGMYRGLQPRSLWGSSISTVAITSVLVVTQEFSGNDGAYETLLRAVNAAIPTIKRKVEIQE